MLENMTVVELRARAKSLGMKGYSKLDKYNLICDIKNFEGALAQEQRDAFQDEFSDYAELREQEIMDSSEAKAPEFDYKRYLGFEPTHRMIGQSITAGQEDLLLSLITNYKVSIDTSMCKDRYSMSVKLNKVLNAIHRGEVPKRSDEEIIARLEAYRHSDKPQASSASKAQLELIAKLEKETGVMVSEVIKTSEQASSIIKRLLEAKKTAVHKEVAVDTVQEKLASFTFRTKLAAMFKRIFA